MENFQQVDLTNYATKLEVNNAKTDLQNKITTNRSDIADLQIHTVKTNTDQTINGTKTFAYKILANGGIKNIVDPTNDTDVVNKRYVDNLISQIPNGGYTVIFSNPGTFNNLQALSPVNIPSNTASNKPLIIQFDRMGSNGNTYEGTINYAFILPDLNKATFADCTVYFNNSNKRFDAGARAGITILRTGATTLTFTFQC